jgi:hypothetical protein
LFGYAHSVAFPALSAKAGTVKQVDIGLEDFAIAVVDERDEVNGHDHNLKRLATSHQPKFENQPFSTATPRPKECGMKCVVQSRLSSS